MDILLTCLFIFFARIGDVSLSTLKTLFILKGNKKLSTVLGFFEILIWYIVVRQALSTEQFNIYIALAYAGGYASGVLIGAVIEEALAIGNLSIQIIIPSEHTNLISKLRNNNFGVSVIECEGKVTKKVMLMIEISRKRLKELQKLIKEEEPTAFITIADTKTVMNGYFG